jgi:hypothetical protein
VELVDLIPALEKLKLEQPNDCSSSDDNLDARINDTRRVGIYIPQGEPTPVDYLKKRRSVKTFNLRQPIFQWYLSQQ